MALPLVSYVVALRVLIDLTHSERTMRCEVLAVRLALFGPEGHYDLKASFRGEAETSWHLPLEMPVPEQPHAVLRPDPRDVDVIYFCCDNEEAPFRRFANATRGETVVAYVQESLSNLELTTKVPVAFSLDPKKQKAGSKSISGGKKLPHPRKHVMHGFTREQYFLHLLRGPRTLEILRLLNTDVDDEDITSLHVFEKKMAITNSTDIYVSWHTVVSHRTIL